MLPGLTTASGGQWQRASDPWVAFGPGGRVYYASLLFNENSPANAIGVSASADGGLTWDPPVVVHREAVDFNDKEALVVDTSAASPGYGSVYVSWDINENQGTAAARQNLVVSRSTDGGATWSDPVSVKRTGANVGVVPRVGPDGTVYLVWSGGSATANRLAIFFSKSEDGGRTWTRRRKVAKIRSNGIRDMRVGHFLASFDVDRNTGDLYVAWQDARFTGVDQPALVVSRDGGATWGDVRRVGDAPDDAPCFTVSVAANGEGDVAVSYFSLENDPARRFRADHFVAISRDRAGTFAPAERVTPDGFDVRFAAQANTGFFLGDYMGLAGGAAAFHLIWVAPIVGSDLNPGRLQPDAFAAVATP